MWQNVVVVGAQWGDEGKGKVVDALADHFDIVARYQGGANAGHTVIVNGTKFILQLLPTGVVRADKTAVIGNGVVVNPDALLDEVARVEQAGVAVGSRLLVSDRAHLILPYHPSHEKAAEQARGAGKIGTTAKGIGPCYEDKAARRGLRAGDLRHPEEFIRKCSEIVTEKNRIASALFPDTPLEAGDMAEKYFERASAIVPYIADTSAFLNAQMAQGKRVLFEGAQGTLLDVDHGTYPFVTSSNASAGGACTGTGVGPTRIHAAVGVSKAYCTRVGSGPFPTRAEGPAGDKLRERGGEYGAVTGRPRLCGWFDVPAMRHSVRLNDFRALVITKLDILDHLAEIPVGVEYELCGKRVSEFPAELSALENVKVHCRTMPGWQQPTFGLTEFSQLPLKAQDYLKFLSDQIGVEIAMVSTGPERHQTIWLNEHWEILRSQKSEARS